MSESPRAAKLLLTAVADDQVQLMMRRDDIPVTAGRYRDAG